MVGVAKEKRHGSVRNLRRQNLWIKIFEGNGMDSERWSTNHIKRVPQMCL